MNLCFVTTISSSNDDNQSLLSPESPVIDSTADVAIVRIPFSNTTELDALAPSGEGTATISPPTGGDLTVSFTAPDPLPDSSNVKMKG
jgi:archaellin